MSVIQNFLCFSYLFSQLDLTPSHNKRILKQEVRISYNFFTAFTNTFINLHRLRFTLKLAIIFSGFVPKNQ